MFASQTPSVRGEIRVVETQSDALGVETLPRFICQIVCLKLGFVQLVTSPAPPPQLPLRGALCIVKVAVKL